MHMCMHEIVTFIHSYYNIYMMYLHVCRYVYIFRDRVEDYVVSMVCEERVRSMTAL